MPSARRMGLALAVAMILGPHPAARSAPRAAGTASATDTVFVWTVEPYRLDLTERNHA